MQPYRIGFGLLIWLVVQVSADERKQTNPVITPLPEHPGNIFLEGEEVTIPYPTNASTSATHWLLLDADLATQRREPLPAKRDLLTIGKLPVGWYRIEFLNASETSSTRAWTTLAVLAPLEAAVPESSPIGVDSAAAWFARDGPAKQKAYANIAALAGVKWVRDRLRWGDIQPEPENFVRASTTYDTSARVHAEAGLNTLQVFHDTPKWAREAGTPGGHFAPDLRHVYEFCKELSRRFKGVVAAWEPWNEANVTTFGGHTVDQMCSWQKAAWLGFKAGDPEVIVGWNPTAAVPTPQHARGVLANETWPYYDTYNIHTYDWAHSYDALWEPAREAAAGRPLWITEADRGIPHLKNAPWFDQDSRLEKLKAEWIAQSYAQSLFAGAKRHFHFILGHYHEPNGVQFGLLRLDLTPRPAYVALAALGRLLAGAVILGRWRPLPDVHVYAFRAFPGGRERDVLLTWAERDVDWAERGAMESQWPIPDSIKPESVFDHLGRPMEPASLRLVKSAPVIVVSLPGTALHLPLEKAEPLQSEIPPLQASPIVLQALVARKDISRVEDLPWSEGHVYEVTRGQRFTFEVAIYNFSEESVTGEIRIQDAPAGWRLELEERGFQLAPQERKIVNAHLWVSKNTTELDSWLVIAAEGLGATKPKLALRFKVAPTSN